MILEQIVIDILKEDMPNLFSKIRWDGMYDESAKKIVKMIKEELVKLVIRTLDTIRYIITPSTK